uniref:Solute carrier family 40 protein n=1 Tax=Oxyrrhis marina TaxID=2969 RepID=A0A7S4LPC2_OXYMA
MRMHTTSTRQILVQLVLILAASIGTLGRSAGGVRRSGAGVAAYPQWALAVIAIAGAMAFATEAHHCYETGYLVRGTAMTMPSTLLNVADLCTDALSAGSMIASSFCEGCRMEEAWGCAWSNFCQLASWTTTCMLCRQVVLQSSLPFHMPLWVLALVAWLLTGLQFGAALSNWEESPSVVFDALGFETLSDFWKEVDTKRAAEAGMASEAAEARKDLEVMAGRAGMAAHEAGSASDASEQDNERAAIARFVTKFFFRLLAENAFQLHVQITTVALSVALMGWSDAAEMMLYSIGISAAMLIAKLAQSLADLRMIWQDVTDPVLQVMIVGAVVLTLLVVVYALAKIWALFWCPDHIFNVRGCAEMNL